MKNLCEILPKAQNSMAVSVIFHYYQYCIKIIDKYISKIEYMTKKFIEVIYHNNRQVVNIL